MSDTLLLTITEAAQKLRVSTRTVRRLIQAGELTWTPSTTGPIMPAARGLVCSTRRLKHAIPTQRQSRLVGVVLRSKWSEN
ncbi:MAG: helix-turn-helix domain-containing protein [Gammaproteobacteria bacterium]